MTGVSWGLISGYHRGITEIKAGNETEDDRRCMIRTAINQAILTRHTVDICMFHWRVEAGPYGPAPSRHQDAKGDSRPFYYILIYFIQNLKDIKKNINNQ